MKDVKLWLAHETYGGELAKVAGKTGDPRNHALALRSLAATVGVPEAG